MFYWYLIVHSHAMLTQENARSHVCGRSSITEQLGILTHVIRLKIVWRGLDYRDVTQLCRVSQICLQFRILHATMTAPDIAGAYRPSPLNPR